MAGKKGMAHYNSAVKEQAIRMVIEHGMTHRAVVAALGIRDLDRVKKWMHAYCREGLTAFHKPKGRRRKDQGETGELKKGLVRGDKKSNRRSAI